MDKVEYSTEYVPRRYPQEHMQEKSPMADSLNRKGDDGWNLCAVSSPDSCGVVVCYFSRVKQDTMKESDPARPNRDLDKEFNFHNHQNKPNKQWHEVTDQGYFEAGWDAAMKWMTFHAFAKLIDKKQGIDGSICG